MPALTSLVLTDRESTPVNHTFVPDDRVGGVGVLVESTGVKLGDSKFTLSSRKTANGRHRATLKLEIPRVENAVIDGLSVPKVVRTAYATVELSFSDASTTQERKNLVGMLEDSLKSAKTMVNAVIVDLEGIYG